MEFFEDYCLGTWRDFNKYVDQKYVIGENHFVRKRKTTQEDIMKYPLMNHGRTNAIESLYFISEVSGDEEMTISKSAIGQQRTFIDPQAYIDMNEDFINGIYNDYEEKDKFKEYILLACDSSVCDSPNTKLTYNEYNQPHFNLIKKELLRFRASCIADVNLDFILTSEFTSTKVDELTLAKKHFFNIKNRFPNQKFITIYDRGYNSMELMIIHHLNDSKFLIRLPKDNFKKERKQMTSGDEIVSINLNRNRKQNFKDKELKEKASQLQRIDFRITEIELIDKNGNHYTEILISNLEKEKFTIEDLRELYRRRWKIETNFNRLKNIIMLENFTGHRKIILEQDFYANIYIFNFLIAMKHDANNKIEEKHKNKNNKYEYQTNLNVLFGKIKMEIPNLLTPNPEKQEKAVQRIMKIATTNLVKKDDKKERNPERLSQDPKSKYPYTQRRST